MTRPETAFSIREFTPRDIDVLKSCFVELQEYERELVHHRLPGAAIADRYIESLVERTKGNSAVIFLAETKGEAVGFICVFLSEKLDEELNEPVELAYISDIVVKNEYRRMGVGEALVKRAEEFAIERKVSYISTHVLANNDSGRTLYGKAGFKEYELFLLKRVP